MKNLITAIRAQLWESIRYVSKKNVFVAQDLMIVPSKITFPAIGIKDGDAKHAPAYQDGEENIQRVTVAYYAQDMRDEQAIMGDTGVLQGIADIITALNNNDLSQTGINLAIVESETASKTIFNDQDMAQMKTVIFRYERLADY